jgi:hypothetical protein
MASLRTGTVRIVEALTLANAASAAPTADANGVAIPDGFRHEYAHMIAKKTNVGTFAIYGQTMLGSANAWVYMDEIAMSRTGNEMVPVKGLCGMTRACAVRLDANVVDAGSAIYFGFHEAHGVG